MNNKSFFWFLLNETFQDDCLKEFKEISVSNSGIAITLDVYQKTTAEIFGINKSTFKIPLSIYLHDVKDIKTVNADCFKNRIVFFDKKALDETHLENNITISFKLFCSGKTGIIDLLDQLTDYFLFRAMYSSTKVIIEIEAALIQAIPDFFNLMTQLGVGSYLINYSKENIHLIKGCQNLLEPFSDIQEKSPIQFNKWRNDIDELDRLLIETLARRMQIVNKMGVHKNLNNLPLFEPQRWNEILISRKKMAKKAGLDEELIQQIFEKIHLSALRKMMVD